MMKIDVEQEVSNTKFTNKVVWDAAVKVPSSYLIRNFLLCCPLIISLNTWPTKSDQVWILENIDEGSS